MNPLKKEDSCGKQYFATLEKGENPAKYIHTTSVDDLMKETRS